jgi:multidrug resistance efflux pump
MIKSIRKRARPDALKNQVRAGGQTFARRLYLYCVVGLFIMLGWAITGHWFFLDAEGIVTKERTVIAPDYSARITALSVKPGDIVKPGTEIATLQSREILDQMAEFTSRRATILSREAQIAGRIETIRKVLPDAGERRLRAIETKAQIAKLSASGLTTAPRVQEAQREFYEAQREESSLKTELAALDNEHTNISAARKDMDAAIAQVQASYNGGKVIAQAEGIVGAKVPHLGQIVKSGDALVEVYRGEMFVLAYMPIGRLYSISPQDSVRVSDGQHTYPGRVERIENVTDSLPPEFQVSFRSTDRQQIFRVVFDTPPPFAIQAKIRLSSPWSPQGLMSLGMGLIMQAGETASGWMRFSGNQIAAKAS